MAQNTESAAGPITTYDEYLRRYRPAEWEAQQVREHAEVLHAERHSGLLVPTLDSCGQHSRAEFESMARTVRWFREVRDAK